MIQPWTVGTFRSETELYKNHVEILKNEVAWTKSNKMDY